ncbi:hypothetical protein BDU57DRAFT_450413 [Ampelomyces quisqualis]|uniref:Gag1-like clamp domain-containing protein n=1 Tax=Ampelomyces quisqualis TaxID=50730 RepID=A0A6A5QQT3_AMPQU|nr:hypothetical protein BDU57DRAFT_450413 [Ampelomyces quisqualis]
MESNQTAARAAKRFLQDRVRNDWSYPDAPPVWSASDEEVRDAQQFCARYYGESESSDSGPGAEAEAGHGAGTGAGTGAGAGAGAAPYKFDSPDSIGPAVAQMREARRTRRRERLEDEMRQNEGLSIWIHRRDVWTGAASVIKYGTRRRANSATPPPSASPPPDDAVPGTLDVVPVAPRLLEANPIRASITPKAYSDIYQKIVVSSRTPSVPINLADMTKALVQGWKDSDEWPSRAALIDPLVGKRRGVPGAAVTSQQAGFITRHPHLEKGVDSVKRIFHLNGHSHGSEYAHGGKVG